MGYLVYENPEDRKEVKISDTREEMTNNELMKGELREGQKPGWMMHGNSSPFELTKPLTHIMVMRGNLYTRFAKKPNLKQGKREPIPIFVA